MKKILVTLAMALMTAGMFSCKSDDSTTNPPTNPTSVFRFKAGDYTRYYNYNLDSSNALLPATKSLSSRTILKSGVSIGDKSDAVMVIDTVYNDSLGKSFNRLDTTYWRFADNSVYIYNFAKIIAAQLAGTMEIIPTPSWTKVAELYENESTAFTDNIQISSSGSSMTLAVSGKNKGKTSAIVNGQTIPYTTFKTELTISAAMLGVSIPVEFYVGGISGSSLSPSTIVKFKFSSFTIPLFGKVGGKQQELIDFKAGQ